MAVSKSAKIIRDPLTSPHFGTTNLTPRWPKAILRGFANGFCLTDWSDQTDQPRRTSQTGRTSRTAAPGTSLLFLAVPSYSLLLPATPHSLFPIPQSLFPSFNRLIVIPGQISFFRWILKFYRHWSSLRLQVNGQYPESPIRRTPGLICGFDLAGIYHTSVKIVEFYIFGPCQGLSG